MNDYILELKQVTKRYGDKVVLNELDLAIPRGSVVGLLGKNGAGKSTLIKCALGLIKPQSGAISILGEPAWELSAEGKARLGYVPQVVQLYPWMKVRQVINLIRGRDAESALGILAQVPKGSTPMIRKVLSSAISNAKQKGLVENQLFISKIIANPGPMWKRFRAAAFGRASSILRKTTHLTIELDVKIK